MKATPKELGRIINDIDGQVIGNHGGGSWCDDIIEIHITGEDWANLQALALKHPKLKVKYEDLDKV
jgi:hypothetical protein